ncbi:MAG: diacylglycerol kinase family lipid kinase [Bacteroidetes bacterium]|nr:diacylglycerol kinase family lipid kinase [Bacteroidota bacterium]
MENIKKQWLVIVNLHAGSKKCERDWPEIKSLLLNAGFDMHIVFTEYQNHAMQLAKSLIEEEGFKKIIVVGGDGTLNEVVNSVFKQNRFRTMEIQIGLITVGTGNDWGRMYEIPESYEEQVEIVKGGLFILQDVGVVKYRHASEEDNRYFANIAGMGYDALVAKKTNVMKQRGRGGALVYMINLVSGLFQYKNTQLEIEADGKLVFTGRVFTMSIGICKYNGAGMMQLPFAIPDDGLFDVTVIRKTTKMRVIKNIKNLYDGSFINMREVETFTGKKFTIRSTPSDKLFLETDGESLGHSPLDFEVIPRAAKMIVRKRYAIID